MTETTKVLEVSSDEVVVGCITSSCENCSGNSFCNVKEKTFTAANPKNLDIHKGDTVDVYLPPGKTIISGFMILMLPLALFLGGLIGTRWLVPDSGEGFQALGGFIGMAVGFLIGYLFGQAKKHKYQPIITSVHGTGDSER